jgi:hypothetical protein
MLGNSRECQLFDDMKVNRLGTQENRQLVPEGDPRQSRTESHYFRQSRGGRTIAGEKSLSARRTLSVILEARGHWHPSVTARRAKLKAVATRPRPRPSLNADVLERDPSL